MGGCISSFSQKQTKRDTGISSATYSQTINKKPVNNRFHENDNVNGSTTNNKANKANKAKVIKRQKKKIHKGLIGLPSNFQHTGHIGITELRSGKVDPEKIKNQMAEVAAALSLEGLNIGSTIPSANDTDTNNDINNHEIPTTSPEQQIVNDINNNNNSRPISLQNESQFKVKRKPTLTPISSPVISSPVLQQQNSRQLPSTLVDPMTEIVAALKLPIDGNFDKNDQKLVV